MLLLSPFDSLASFLLSLGQRFSPHLFLIASFFFYLYRTNGPWPRTLVFAHLRKKINRTRTSERKKDLAEENFRRLFCVKQRSEKTRCEMGRPPCCDKEGVKKGPWTPEEDILLVSYIQEHGPGNWRAVPTNTG